MYKLDIPAAPSALHAAVAALTCGVLLTACGGGGDSTPPLPSGTVTSSGCTVPDGASTCDIGISWTTVNAVTPRLTVNGTSASTLASGSTTVAVAIGSAAVTVSDGTTVLATATASASCGTSSVVSGGVCAPAILHYTDKVLALWTAAYPYAVTKDGVTQVVNKTSVAGLRPFFNCWLYKQPQADGRVLASCQQVLVFTRKVHQIDLVANEMSDYAGTAPSDDDPNWVDVQAFDPAKPEWGPKTKVSDGWFFTTFDKTWVLKFQSDTGAVSDVKVGTFEADGTVKVLVTYGN